jgi:serine/threonine protein kinase
VVAIKTIRQPTSGDAVDEEIFQRFKREGMAGARLSHPNVVGIHEYGETDQLAYIVMDFVSGESLKALNLRKGRWPLFEALDLAYQLLEALDYFHQRGIVHRDIKPSNIMIDAANHLTVTDLGIARVENSTLTQVGTILGTPWYMSPEQITEQPLDGRSDLFSVGIILYEMLTGTNPFKADQLHAILDKIVVEPHAPPSAIAPGLPPAIDRLFEKALAKKAADRFQSGNEFRLALRQMLTEVLPDPSNTAGWHPNRSKAISQTPQTDPPPLHASMDTPNRAPTAAVDPATLLPSAFADVEPRKSRSRWLTWLLAGLAISVLLVLVVPWTPSPQSARPMPQEAPTGIQAAASSAPDEAATPEKGTPGATAQEDHEDSPLIAEIRRQCANPRVSRLLVPDVNGIVRCGKEPICGWDNEAIHEMHRKMAALLAQAGTSTDMPPVANYFDQVGCITGLPKATTAQAR